MVIESDFSRFEGTNCFCSEESAGTIRQIISGMPLGAIHRIGTGDYHYVTLFWLEMIREPFVLFLFDNHPDDLQSAFGDGLLSCGGWMREALKLNNLKAAVWYDGEGGKHVSGDIDDCPKAYISIDLDVLSGDYAKTDWSQGRMTLDELLSHISEIKNTHKILGTDLCGGLTPEKGASSADITLNARTEEAIISLLED